MTNRPTNSGPAHSSLLLTRVGAARQLGVQLLPGLCFCSVVVLAAGYISDHYGAPLILSALLLGMAFNSVSRHQEFATGISFCAQKVLRFGVALLGVRISFGQIAELGYRPLLLVLVVVVATLLFSLLLARLLRLDRYKGIVSGAAVAICGASAALAVAAALQGSARKNASENEKHLLCTLVGVTGLSTIVMILYPGMVSHFGFSVEQMGMFLGASIHDVAQVMGAGHMISDQVADMATYTKMLRVSMLLPVIMLLAVCFREPGQSAAGPGGICPPFLLGFVALIVIANLGILPAAVISTMSDISKVSLLLAMAALGTRTNLVETWQVGAKPIALLILNTLFIAGLSFWMVL